MSPSRLADAERHDLRNWSIFLVICGATILVVKRILGLRLVFYPICFLVLNPVIGWGSIIVGIVLFISWVWAFGRFPQGEIETMIDQDAEKLVATMVDPMEGRNVRFEAVMKATREAVVAEAAKGDDARAGLAGILFEAAVAGDLRMVTRCLDIGIDPNWPRRNGTDVLRDIVGMGDARLEVTKLLVSRGADPNVGTVPVLRQIQGPAFCDNERTIAFLRSIKARE